MQKQKCLEETQASRVVWTHLHAHGILIGGLIFQRRQQSAVDDILLGALCLDGRHEALLLQLGVPLLDARHLLLVQGHVGV